ncbi:hypothetical protein BO86DRAFT_145062 [Aspergillus japonicus CBS 114.51]|uniref:Uncharacterized protein n=1 Tax=Aspergillus japonicus CBS 114.51 TaxID=1448312 RepID=A0A8T8WVH8_ASPJA|nr:hypothetical protein BO86DRAFT_145062 [Aspergillus japonicus CBS 114.51]RAH79836.1 hypothetical protein BO86DRAFT_145062 [Aspergillus japonicus CBS 114.51]
MISIHYPACSCFFPFVLYLLFLSGFVLGDYCVLTLGRKEAGGALTIAILFIFFPPLSLFVTSSLGNRVILLYRLDTTFCTGLSPLCLCYGFHLGFNFIALMSDPSTCEHGGTVCLGGRRR